MGCGYQHHHGEICDPDVGGAGDTCPLREGPGGSPQRAQALGWVMGLCSGQQAPSTFLHLAGLTGRSLESGPVGSHRGS